MSEGERNIMDDATKDEAHIYLQLAQWSYNATRERASHDGETFHALKEGEWGRMAEMEGDGWKGPFDPPDAPSPVARDRLEGELAEFVRVGSFLVGSDDAIEGNVFKRGDEYFMVFDGSVDDLLDDWAIADGRLATQSTNFQYTLNRAYGAFRSVQDTLNIRDKKITLVGHSLGGALASTLATAVDANAFTKDKIITDKNEIAYGAYDSRLARGGGEQYTDGEGREVAARINSRGGERLVSAVTFNAPAMGWFFRDIERLDPAKSMGVGDMGTGIAPDMDVFSGKPFDCVKDAPVREFGMDGDTVFNMWRDKYPLGRGEGVYRLDRSDGKIPEHIQKLQQEKVPKGRDGVGPGGPGLFFDHKLKTLELAFQDLPEKNHENKGEQSQGEASRVDEPGQAKGMEEIYNMPEAEKRAIQRSAMTKMADYITQRQNVFEDAVHGKNGGRVEYVGPVMMQSVNFTLQNTGNGVMVFHETEAVGDIPQKNIQNEDVVRVAYEGGRCSVSVEAEKEMDKAVGLER